MNDYVYVLQLTLNKLARACVCVCVQSTLRPEHEQHWTQFFDSIPLDLSKLHEKQTPSVSFPPARKVTIVPSKVSVLVSVLVFASACIPVPAASACASACESACASVYLSQ